MRRLVTLLALLSCFAAGLVVANRVREATEAGAQAPAQSTAKPTVTAPGPVAAGATLTDFTRVAERTIPAVVNISAQQIVRRRVPVDPFFGSLFGDPDAFFGTRRGVENSLGSGVIVSSDGFILTNNHVVRGENDNRRVTIEQFDVTVALADKRELRADVVGVDPATDLALLKVSATNLPTIPWGDSSRLKVAEWVLAIGNPYQLSQTVTLGIVSAVGRTNLGISAYEDFVQTDAAINPGNSGGALVNGRGELVGINTVIYSESGGYQGIGFAVSSNLARRVVNDLQQYQEVRRGSIGPLWFQPLTTQMAEELGVSSTGGVFVARMMRASAAYQGGLRPGDLIVRFNGTTIEDPSHFSRLVSDAPIGSTATVTVIRDRREIDLRIPIVKVSRN
jgi:Do/DeqQ family serine protease